MSRLCDLTARGALSGLRAGQFSAVELVEDCLRRIDECDDEVQAFSVLDRDLALVQARELDQGARTELPLFGLPLGIKDIFDTAGLPTERGSPIHAGRIPDADASSVSLARASGANVFAKTVTTEFAYFFPGKTRNPWNSAHTPGGSSMGSAAAVARGMLPLAYGSQTAASVNRPAAYCGVIGYKASHGQVHLDGVAGLSTTLDTFGCFARSVRDVALVRAALLGDDADPPARQQPPRIAFCRTPQWQECDRDSRNQLEAIAAELASAGAPVDELELQGDFARLIDLQKTIMAFEAARARHHEYNNHAAQLSEQFRGLVEDGLGISHDAWHAAMLEVRQIRADVDTLFNGHDLLLTPSAPGEAPQGLDATGDPLFSRSWTLLHTPTINLPIGRGPRGLPIGAQLVGRCGADTQLVVDAEWLETALS